MALTLFFIGAAAATGLLGAGKTVGAIMDDSKANEINKIANKEVEEMRNILEVQRKMWVSH